MSLKTEPTESRILPAMLLSAAVLTALYLFFWHYYQTYFPWGDDPATAFGWDEGFGKWFTVGYRDLLIPYPEWYIPEEDFMRPGSSLMWWAKQVLFGSHYALSFAEHYVVQFCAVLVVVKTGRLFSLPTGALSVLAILTTVNAAFVNWIGLTCLSAQNDLLVALMSVLAFYLLCRDRYWLALVPLTYMAFTKETGLIFPVAACVATFLTSRRRGVALLLLAPDVLWYFVRRIVFGADPAANYAVPNDPKALVLLAVKGIFFWPTGAAAEETARTIFATHSIRGHVVDVIFMAFNFLLWAAIGYILRAVVRPAAASELRGKRDMFISLIIWALGALAFGCLGPRPQFGGSIYMFLLLLFFITFHYNFGIRMRQISFGALAILAGAFLWDGQLFLRNVEWDSPHSMKQLVAALQRFNSAGKTIYVVNFPQSYASNSFITKFAGVDSHLIRLNEFGGCIRASNATTYIQTEGTETTITANLPACARLAFNQVHSPKLAAGIGGRASRGTLAEYSFPAGRIVSQGVRTADPQLDLGNQVDIRLTTQQQEPVTILYYDWNTADYKCAGSGCLAR